MLEGKTEKILFESISTELLQNGYGVRFRPAGLSMHPTIRDGERVTVEPVRAQTVRCGDILLYLRRERVIAHRVVGVHQAEDGESFVFTLRGDSLSSCDAPVRAEQVLGRVVTVERDGREINLRSRRGLLQSAVLRRAARLRRGLSHTLGFLRVLRKPLV